MEAMTSEREAFEAAVRQWPNYSERTLARDGRYPEYYGSPVVQGAWEGWKARAHLAQPAQAVDVGALPDALRLLEEYALAGVTLGTDDATRLQAITHALSGEKAGPVDGFVLVPCEPTPAMRAAFRADPDALTYFTHTTLQCQDFDSRYRAMLGAASPAPGKDWK